jgi:hypothetical protein
MPNKNYLRGRRFEYEYANLMREQGFTIARTAGSHGLFDLIGINEKNGMVELIQCKVTEDPTEARRLIRSFKESPPVGAGLLPKRVHQGLAVKVLGNSEIRTVFI